MGPLVQGGTQNLGKALVKKLGYGQFLRRLSLSKATANWCKKKRGALQ